MFLKGLGLTQPPDAPINLIGGGTGVSGSGFYSPSYSSPSYSPYQVGTPTFSPSFGSPGVFNTPLPDLAPYYSPAPSPAPMQTEHVVVTATPSPAQVGTPTISPNFTPNYFNFSPPALTPYTPPPPMQTEHVVVTATPPPVPQQVMLPAFTPIPTPAITPNEYLPTLPPVVPARKTTAPAPQTKPSAPHPPPPPFPPPAAPPQKQQQPIVINNNIPRPAPIAGVTPQQQAQLAGLTPAQLQQLLQNPNLTPQQRAAVQQALTAQNQAALNAARAGTGATYASPAAAAAAAKAAQAASPLQPISFVLPLLIAAGVATAWGLTHQGEVKAQYRATVKRVRKVLH